METWLLLPVALIWLFWFGNGASTEPAFWTSTDALWLMAAGPVTLIPLLGFNAAARHLPYSTLGFLQYLTPTLLLISPCSCSASHFRSTASWHSSASGPASRYTA